MGRLRCAAVGLWLVACGPGGLAEEFAGAWSGVSTATMGAQPPNSTAATLGTGVEKDVLAVSYVCFNNTGTLTLRGAGESADWEGSYTCPPVALGSCNSVTVTYSSARATLGNDGSLRVELEGTAVACGGGGRFTLTFVGTRTR